MDIKIHQKKTKKMVNNMYENMDKIINCIDEGNYFIVTSHVNPDGDNIGSTLSMYYYLKSINKILNVMFKKLYNINCLISYFLIH